MKEPANGKSARVLTGRESGQVHQELDRILQSPIFRNSHQGQKFLRYVVERSLEHEPELLRERVIGAEIFGREPSYDTSSDPIVRVRATEVRKRLAQYYQEDAGPHPIRFEIPPGSYIAEFHWKSESLSPPPASPLTRRWLAAAATVALVSVAVAVWAWSHNQPTVLQRFWAAALNSPKPVVICSGHPVVYFLSRRIHQEYRTRSGVDPQAGPYVIQLRPEETVKGQDIVPVTDQFVSVGDAGASARLLAMFAAVPKASEIRVGNDISFSDLRGAPAVLIGAYSNRWTLQMTNELRFVFDQADGVKKIRDRTADGKKWGLPNIAPDGKTSSDYALVSRIFDSKTGDLLIAAAGITQYGTRAAGEFLTSEARLRDLLPGAPPDWERKNLQVVLYADIIGPVPSPPKILATHWW